VKTPIENLFLSTTSQIYPGLTNGESVTRHARQVSKTILSEQLGAAPVQTSQTEHVTVNDRVPA
jgi:hypothetical protein